MTDISYKDAHDLAVAAVRTAGDIARKAFGHSQIEYKESDVAFDVVTAADRDIDAFIRGEVSHAFPSHSIHSEESGSDNGGEYVWTIDPIDGSSNFSRGIPHFAVCLGLIKHEVPVVGVVFNPITNELFSFYEGGGAFLNGVQLASEARTTLGGSHALLTIGSRKENWDWGFALQKKLMEAEARVRNFGASALDLCYLASGKIDAVMYGGVGLRDIVPAVGILRAVGGEVYVFETGDVATLTKEPQRVVASRTKALADTIRALQ